MAEKVKLSAHDYEKKRIMIAGVIDFNGANGIKYGRAKLFNHFGINERTGRNWFPSHDDGKYQEGYHKDNNTSMNEEKTLSATKKKRPNSDLKDFKDIKQDNRDLEVILIKADPDEPKFLAATIRRQNPVRNAGRDRKRLKAMCNALSEEERQPNPDSAEFHTPPPSATPISPPSTGNRGSPPPEQVFASHTRKRRRPREAVIQARREKSPDETFYSDNDDLGNDEPFWV